MNGDPASRRRAIIGRLERRDGASDELVGMLEELRAQLQDDPYGGLGVPIHGGSEVDPADPRLQIILDALAALAPAAAATILPRLDAEDRAEIEPLIGEQVSRTIL